MKKILLILFVVLAIAGNASAEEKKGNTIRLFIEQGDQRMYLLGHHWTSLNLNQKIAMIEQARTGAISMNVVMALPAEVYIKKLNQMLLENPQLRQFELGQVVQGIAVSLNDWDTGIEPSI